MNLFLARYWPLIIAIGIFLGMMTLLVLQSLQHAYGNLVYPLDDTYIHMAIARNTAYHHVWGISQYAFSSTTSSPLWTFLLALVFMVFGENEWVPLILNVIFATWLIAAAGLFLNRIAFPELAPGMRRVCMLVLLLIAMLAAPLPTLTMIGIEHVLHTLLTLGFLGVAIRLLSMPATNYLPKYGLSFYKRHEYPKEFPGGIQTGGAEDETGTQNSRVFYSLILLAPLLTMSRYEGLFLVFVVCVLMLIQKKWAGAILTGAVALLPVIVYGLWSISRGWFFLPNSLLLKGQMPESGLREWFSMVHRTLIELQLNSHLLVLLVLSLIFILLYRFKSYDIRIYFAHLIYSGTLLLHVTFASTGWLFRYEAYLVFTGILILGVSLIQVFPKDKTASPGIIHSELFGRTTGKWLQWVVALLLAGIVAFPFVQRTVYSYRLAPLASGNIYEQHISMGQFLRTYYQGEAVAVNDIGAVSWIADIRLFDLWGLGSLEPTALKRKGAYTTEEIDRLTRKYDVVLAIVYDDWFDGESTASLPQNWEQVGQWRIDGNVIAGSDIVSFYAVKADRKDELIHNLNSFSDKLPPGVTVFGLLPDE